MCASLPDCPEQIESDATEAWRPVLMLSDREKFLPDM